MCLFYFSSFSLLNVFLLLISSTGYKNERILRAKLKFISFKKNLQFIKGDKNREKWDTYQTLDVVRSIIGDINGL